MADTQKSDQVDRGSVSKAKLLELGQFVLYLLRQFRANQGSLNAAALTYTTLFAVVPLMTVTYAVLSSIPAFKDVGVQLENIIFSHFVPTSGVAVRDYLSAFASQARTLTTVGIGFLVITAYMMLKTIENSLNRIWRVAQPRKGIASFLLYWAVLSLGPVLLGLGFALTSYITTLPLISDATEVVNKAGLLKLLPILTSTGAFTLIYAAVPNCPVRVRHAIIGGLVVALIFEAAKQSFTLFVTQFPSYELIYGAFAAVPIFLAWVFISWMIILLGAELVRALSHYHTDTAIAKDERLPWVLLILEQGWLLQGQGKALSTEVLIKKLPGLSPVACDDYLATLLTAHVVERTEVGDYMIARDLNRFSIHQLCESLPWELPSKITQPVARRWMDHVSDLVLQVYQNRESDLEQDLASLFSQQPIEKNASDYGVEGSVAEASGTQNCGSGGQSGLTLKVLNKE